MYPCGPLPSKTRETFGVPAFGHSYASFFESPGSDAGFQCVELANRFLWVADGLPPISGPSLDGKNYVDTEVSSGQVSASDLVSNTDAKNHPYLPGDVVSFSGFHGEGHVAVVTGSTYEQGDGGTYSVTLMEEDASSTGQTTAQVTGWKMGDPAGSTVTPYDFLELNWSIDLSANPLNAANGQLTGIACPGATSCFAVGSDSPSGGPDYVSLVERWNGSMWAVTPSPDPKSAFQTLQSSIACPTSTKCLAVGEWTTSAGPWTTYAGSWNGKSWVPDKIPNPSSSTQSDLLGVACASATSCFAVGSYVLSSGPNLGYHSLIEHWNGTRWSIVPSPTPTGSTGELWLYGIACPGSTSCVAVGTYSNAAQVSKTLVERWDGSTWHLVTSPNPPEGPNNNDVQLNAVACASTTSCNAVGSYLFPHSKTLIEHWNGTEWSIVPSPDVPGAYDDLLHGIACVGAATCDAVGWSATASGTWTTLVERWDGAQWSIVPSPNVPGGNASSLDAIACPSPVAACHAVGAANSSEALAEFGWP